MTVYEPIAREWKEAERILADGLIPTKPRLEIRSIPTCLKPFQRASPSSIYNEIVTDSRSTLPVNVTLRDQVNGFYENVFISNIEAVYTHAASWWSSTFSGSYKQSAFHEYEKYVYLLSLIVYVNTHREDLKGTLDHDADAFIQWALLRENSSLEYILKGPTVPSEINDFRVHYWSLVSPATLIDDINNQTKIAKLSSMNASIVQFRAEMDARPNVFDKNLDRARQYFLVIRDGDGLEYELNDRGNVIFDASYLDLGETAKNKTPAEYTKIRVREDRETGSPSRMTSRSIQQLFNVFNSIAVEAFRVSYALYSVDLSKFSEVYLTFPGIRTAEHTVIGNAPRGTLRIGGRFERNDQRAEYVFKPNEPLVTFDGSQTAVHNMQFYITASIDEDSLVTGYAIRPSYISSNVYNHLIQNRLLPTDTAEQVTVDSSQITFAVPTKLSDINSSNDYISFVDFIKSLSYIPSIWYEYLDTLPRILEKWNQLKQIVPASVGTTNETIIGSGTAQEYIDMEQIEKTFQKMSVLLRILNDSLQEWRHVQLPSGKPDILPFSDTPQYRSIARTASYVSMEGIRFLIRSLCSLSLTEMAPSTNQTLDGYLSVWIRVINVMLTPIVDVPIPVSIKPVYKYILTGSAIQFVPIATSDADPDVVPKELNDAAYLQVGEQPYIYGLDRQTIRRVPGKVIQPEAPVRLPVVASDYVFRCNLLVDSEGYSYRSGGWIETSTITPDTYGLITDEVSEYDIYVLSDATAKLEVVKWLPSQYLATFTHPLVSFESDTSFTVNGSRQLSLLSAALLDYVQLTSLAIDQTLGSLQITSEAGSDVVNVTDGTHSFEFTMKDGLVVQMKVLHFIDGPVIKMTYDPMSCSISDDYTDYTSEVRQLDPIDKSAFGNDNLYKTYRCYTNLIESYWENSMYENALLTIPLADIQTDPVEVDDLTITADEKHFIYTREPFNQFNLLVKLSGIPGVFLNKEYYQTATVYVAAQEEELYSLVGAEQPINTETVNLSITNEKNEFLNFALTFNDNVCTKIQIDDTVMIGQFRSLTQYSTTIRSVKGRAYIQMEYDVIDDQLTLKSFLLYASAFTLSKYTFGETSYQCILPSFTPTKTVKFTDMPYLDIIREANPTAVYSQMAYRQYIIENRSFTDNGKLRMVIKDDGKAPVYQLSGRLQADRSKKEAISASIPVDERHLVENIDGNLVVDGIRNTLKTDSISDRGFELDMAGNDLIYLSLNVK